MTDHPKFTLPVLASEAGRFDYPYWKTGERTGQDELFDFFEARPKAIDSGEYDYQLVTPRDNIDAMRKQVSISRIAGRSAAANQLSHPLILPLVDAELDRPPFFWVEPRLRFPNLVQVLEEFQLTVSSTIWIIRQVSQAILIAHDQLRTLSALEPSQIHVSPAGRVIIGGLDVSVPFGQPFDATIADCNQPANQGAREKLMSGPEVDLANFGRLIQWMIDRTGAESMRSPIVDRLAGLAAQAMDSPSARYAEGLALSGRILDGIINLELENVMNDRPFGKVA